VTRRAGQLDLDLGGGLPQRREAARPAGWPFGDLRPGHFRVVLADPPWTFRTYSPRGLGKSPQRHYRCEDLEWIKALPVADLAHPDGCALVLWATAPMLPQAVETLAAWGFAFKSAGSWAKQSRTGAKWHFGTGYTYRSAAEFWLLGTRGRPVQTSRAVRNLIVAPVREHSRKPDQMHMDLEAMYAGPRCELFARGPARPGWELWGDEASRFEAA
jgi:N6-adenosine-specific RNA methylase IME4